jgi:hypothetical protein
MIGSRAGSADASVIRPVDDTRLSHPINQATWGTRDS